MTTVAWDNKVLSSDSLFVVGEVKDLGTYPKICIPSTEEKWTIHGLNVIAFGWSGDVTCTHLIKGRLSEDLTLQTKSITPEELIRFDAIIVTDTNAVFHWVVGMGSNENIVSNLYSQDGPLAIGSGGKFALGVMAIGGDAIMGVKAGIMVDVNSGGDIIVWKKEDPLKITKFSHEELAAYPM